MTYEYWGGPCDGELADGTKASIIITNRGTTHLYIRHMVKPQFIHVASSESSGSVQ